jgi:hypothetical protein
MHYGNEVSKSDPPSLHTQIVRTCENEIYYPWGFVMCMAQLTLIE